jgi:hypothetical protein
MALQVTNQVNPTYNLTGQLPYVQQQNFGQMIGEVAQWTPNCDIAQIQVFINNAVRVVLDRRLWYSLLVKGQLVSSGFYSTGTLTTVDGSPIVTGIGTAWTTSLVGQALRVGYTTPIYQIIAVDATHQTLTLELPWGGPAYSGIGYYITQYYYSIPNIKFIYTAVNLQLQYRLWTNVAQTLLDNIDPSRLRVMYPYVLATMPPDPQGNYQVEMWPASTTALAFPYKAYVQPPNLVNDSDSLPPFIRCDIIVARAVADALRYRTKDNPYYSEAVALSIAAEKMKEFEAEVARAEGMDENLWRADYLNMNETYPTLDLLTGLRPGGDFIRAMTPESGWGDGW